MEGDWVRRSKCSEGMTLFLASAPHPSRKPSANHSSQQPKSAPSEPAQASSQLKFTAIMNGLRTVYPAQAMADISTSYCFICLLHLANEKGLTLSNEECFTDLGIRRDEKALIEGSEVQ